MNPRDSVVLLHGLHVVRRERLLERLDASGLEADAGLEHLAGRLAGAEPGQAHLSGDALERGVDVLLELRFVDRDGQPDLVALEGLER